MKSKIHLLALAVLFTAQTIFAANFEELYSRAQSLAGRTEGKVFRDAVAPHWLPDGRHFWYRIATGPDAHEYVLVDAETGEVKRAASAEKIGVTEAEKLSTSKLKSLTPKRSTHTGGETAIRFHNATEAPVELFWVDEGGERKAYGRVRPGQTFEQHTYAGHVWLVTDALGNPLGFFEAAADPLEVTIDGKPEKIDAPHPRKNHRTDGAKSPDEQCSIQFENQNAALVLASGETVALTTNGTKQNPFRGPVVWSPDSKRGVIFSVQEVPRHIVTIVESSPHDQLQPKLQTYDYFKPGDALPQVQPWLVSVADKSAKKISNELFANNFTPDSELGNLRWSPRGDEFYFAYNQRGHQV